jgi:hypothetical protein
MRDRQALEKLSEISRKRFNGIQYISICLTLVPISTKEQFHPLTDTISSGAPLTMLFSFSTNPVMEASLPFPLVGRSAVGDESDLLEAAMVDDPLTFFCIAT